MALAQHRPDGRCRLGTDPGNRLQIRSEPQREEALFQAASQLAAPERAVFLNGACHGDPALRQRLEALLAAHEAPARVLGDGPAREVLAPTIALPEPVADEAVGATLGRYKLREKIGEGGCGTVYVAEQTEPVRRRVALKVIKLGMDSLHVAGAGRDERAGRGHALGWCGTRCPP